MAAMKKAMKKAAAHAAPAAHPAMKKAKGHEGDEKVKDGSMKLVAQAIKDQLSRTFQTL